MDQGNIEDIGLRRPTMINRRDFLKLSAAAGAGFMLPAVKFGKLGGVRRALAAPAILGLSDPAIQPKFEVDVPRALDPTFKYNVGNGVFRVGVGSAMQKVGLVDASNNELWTPVWGYGADGMYTWPGKTFEVRKGRPIEVRWQNHLNDLPYLLTGKNNENVPDENDDYPFGDYTGRSVLDTTLHWAYSLHGYENYTIQNDGTPIVAHVHGGHTLYLYDGNPEQFFSPGYKVRGPHWRGKTYIYQNDQGPGTLWYHDHALGITRLNVYAGMAGFYIIRDDFDTGLPGNPAGLPTYPYEAAFAIQDRMFKENGELFYPAFPGDPFYAGFITEEDASLPNDKFPDGGPTALAEFFGDIMVVNGVIWPKMDVELRNYRLRLLNGSDSRFLVLQFVAVDPAADVNAPDLVDGTALPFTVIGSDQGLASDPKTVNTLVFEPGSRYDILFDFGQDEGALKGKRIIMKNIGGDEPFGGTIPGEWEFEYTDRIMAFDVEDSGTFVPAPAPVTGYDTPIVAGEVDRVRKVALFEGKDEFGRLQPLLGTAEAATDHVGNPINWPDTPEYSSAGLVGQMEGSIGWHSPTTENPALNSTEEWEVWNVTGDAHPIHLHLVHFKILRTGEGVTGRQWIQWDSRTTPEDRVLDVDPDNDPSADGTYLVEQPVVQHNSVAGDLSTYGTGFRIVNKTYGDPVSESELAEYVENAPKDMVSALPDQVTRIKATFDRPGRYVWHCHILSHEDHEMMRVLHVGGGA
jgi:spore coat protein A